MKKFSKIVGVFALVLAAGTVAALNMAPVAVAAPAAPAPVLNSTPFTVDAVHSAVIYRIKHLNVAYNYGRFNELSGKFLFDKSDPSKSVLEVTAKTNSIDSGNSKRDDHLKSPDFFSAKEYPTLSFVGKTFKSAGENKYEVTGDLTMKGVTKSVTVTVDDTATGPGRQGGEVAGAETTFKVKRSEFGMDFLLNGLSDEVTLIVAVEGGRK